jgi:hypothetical protein
MFNISQRMCPIFENSISLAQKARVVVVVEEERVDVLSVQPMTLGGEGPDRVAAPSRAATRRRSGMKHGKKAP